MIVYSNRRLNFGKSICSRVVAFTPVLIPSTWLRSMFLSDLPTKHHSQPSIEMMTWLTNILLLFQAWGYFFHPKYSQVLVLIGGTLIPRSIVLNSFKGASKKPRHSVPHWLLSIVDQSYVDGWGLLGDRCKHEGGERCYWQIRWPFIYRLVVLDSLRGKRPWACSWTPSLLDRVLKRQAIST